MIGALAVSVALAGQPVTIEQKTLERDVGDVRYTIALPTVPDGQRVPLVVALHYAGEVTPWYGRGVLVGLVEPGLRSLGAVIAAPDCVGDGWADPSSEQAVLDLLAHLLATQPVDPQRVVLTGYSMGGIGTWALASRHPSRFSAAIPIAGHPRHATAAIHGVPLMAIHGSDDEIIGPAPTEAHVAALHEAGVPARMVLVEGLTHYETGAFVPALERAATWVQEVWSRE